MSKVKKSVKSAKSANESPFTENELHALQKIAQAPYWARKKMKEVFCAQFGRPMEKVEEYLKNSRKSITRTNELPEEIEKISSSEGRTTELRIPFKSLRVEGGVMVFELVLPD